MIGRRTRQVWARGTRERGQSMVELALIMPVFLILLTALLEFGLAFNHHLTWSTPRAKEREPERHW